MSKRMENRGFALVVTLSAGRWKGKYDAMVKAVEGGDAEELIPFEDAKKRRH